MSRRFTRAGGKNVRIDYKAGGGMKMKRKACVTESEKCRRDLDSRRASVDNGMRTHPGKSQPSANDTLSPRPATSIEISRRLSRGYIQVLARIRLSDLINKQRCRT